MGGETILRAGSDGGLVGVAAWPAADANARWAVVFLNAGLVPRVGPSRLWVRLARALALLGHATLRLDFSGVGDSPESAEATRFEARAPQEARAGLDALQGAAGVERFVLVGLCSGAEIAFKTALVDLRVRGVVLINAPRFLEEPSAELVGRLERQQASRYYWRVALRNPRSWWKALTGAADVRAIVRAVVGRFSKRARPGTRASESADALAFQALLQRGVKVALVLSEGDWAQDYLHEILGEEIDSAIVRAVIPGTDHMLTPLSAQARLTELLQGWSREWA